MHYRVYECIVDSWLLQLSVCWTRSIFWIKSDFFDAIHKRNSILNFFTSWLTQISFKLEFSRNCNCWSYWRWRRWSLICCSYNILLVFFKVTCKFFQAAHSLLAVRLPKHFQTNQFFLCFCWCMIWKGIIFKKNFWVANTLHWWVLSSYMLVYSFVSSVLNALTSLLIDSLVTWLSDQLAGKQSNWID